VARRLLLNATAALPKLLAAARRKGIGRGRGEVEIVHQPLLLAKTFLLKTKHVYLEVEIPYVLLAKTKRVSFCPPAAALSPIFTTEKANWSPDSAVNRRSSKDAQWRARPTAPPGPSRPG
jgi:hypothetical protein